MRFDFLQDPELVWGGDTIAVDQLRFVREDSEASLRQYSTVSLLVNGYAAAILDEYEVVTQLAEEFSERLQLRETFVESASMAFAIGWFYQLALSPEKALQFYEQVLEKEPQNAEAYNNLGCVYYFLYEYEMEDALAAFEKAIEINLELAEAFANRGMISSIDLYELETALTELNRAITLNPDYAIKTTLKLVEH